MPTCLVLPLVHGLMKHMCCTANTGRSDTVSVQCPLSLASNVALAPNSSNARRENQDQAVCQNKSQIPLLRGQGTGKWPPGD